MEEKRFYISVVFKDVLKNLSQNQNIQNIKNSINKVNRGAR